MLCTLPSLCHSFTYFLFFIVFPRTKSHKLSRNFRLTVETVDVGDGRYRTVVSGLTRDYTLGEMKHRLGVYLLNIKPKTLRGVLSEGIILVASTPDRDEILEVPTGADVGDRVVCTKYPTTIAAGANYPVCLKSKHWEELQKYLFVDADGVASYKGDSFIVAGKGKCSAPTLRKCNIK